MDRDSIYRKPLHDQDLAGLAELCTNVAHNLSASSKQSDTAHTLHVDGFGFASTPRWTALAQKRKPLDRILGGSTYLDVEWIVKQPEASSFRQPGTL